VHEIFAEQATRTPDATAVVFEDQRLSYGELDRKSNQLAHHLRGLGVGPEVVVGLCVERSVDLVVGLLGILKAGGAYLPLDPSYPPERLNYMMQDAQAPVLICHASLRHLRSEGAIVDVDGEWQTAEPSTTPVTGVLSENLAYVIYTSGSTGRPKGVCVTHGGAINYITGITKLAPLDPGVSHSMWSSSSFDASVYEILCPIFEGGALQIIADTLRADASRCIDWLKSNRIASAFAPPFAVAELSDAIASRPDEFCLKRLLVGVEPIAASTLDRMHEALENLSILNGYGPTETTVSPVVFKVSDYVPQGLTPIGRPLQNTQAYVLDEALEPVPIGVAGEIHICGVQVARGYLNRPDLTAEKFIPNPFGEPGSRMYKTGDLARYLPNGNIEFLGRIDHQVKIRGFRIELGEVEAVLQRCEGVREALVLAREDEPGDKRLVAYVVPMAGALAVAELRSQLSTFLPDYMVPAAWVFLDALPLSPNGKIDRKALPVPELSRDSLAVDYVAPRNSTEELLAGIWAEVLKVERIGAHDNFFALGGHSLLATQVVSRIRTALKTDLPLRMLFEAPSLAALAERISALRNSGHATELLPSIRHLDHGGRALASFAQQRLWFIDQYESGSGLYDIPSAWRLLGALEVHALQQALNELVRRHETLRTVVLADDEQEVVQVVAASLELAIKHTDLSAAPDPQAQLRSLLQAEANAPFDLSKGPLVRFGLVRLALEEHVLLLTMHHIVSDGWSMGVLMRELQVLYAAFTQGQPSPLAELPIQYADYALWQRDWLQGAVLQSQVDFWRKTLEGAPPLIELPLDRPRPAQLSHRGGFVPFELDATSTAALRKLCQQAQVTAFMAAAALLNVLLHRYSRQDDICLGYPVAGRQRKELEGLIGFFVNTLVLRTRVEPRKSFLQLLAQVRESVLDADNHQDLPFEKLVEELKPERSLNHSPLFQVMLAYNNATGERLTLPGLEVTPQDLGETQTAKFDLTLELTEAQNRLSCAIEFNSDLFDRTTIERMVGHFKTLLEAVVANPQSRVQDLPLLTEAERHQILVEWNDTKADFPQDKCIHQLFEEQVERSPDAVAVVFEDQQLTYAQLNAKANQLAHHLRSLGVMPDTLVAICVERSLEMVIGLLGILKAGGAYVPLDPDYPEERLAFMLQDTAAAVLVTQAHLRERVPRTKTLAVCIDSEWGEIGNCAATNPPTVTSPLNLAYCIYTSGSTGRPKGALNSHEGIVNRVHWMQSAYGLHASDVVLQKTPYAFDVSVWEFFWPLIVGARLAMAEPYIHRDPAQLRDAINRYGVTTLHFVPSMLQMFMDRPFDAPPPSLRRILASGEALAPSTMQLCTRRLPSIALHNLYGPTECAVDVTAWCCPSRDTATRISIGKPIANLRIHVLDEQLQPVPVGVAGEIHIAGIGVGRGYLDRPDLTAERFIPNPFGEPGSRMYKTGDLARYLPDGNIEFLGRIDHQVKIRGFRIELGEIEVALQRCEGVREAVVLAREGELGEKRLVAYVVPAFGALAVADLRAQLSSFLPEYMVPSAWVFLDNLPLNPNGKIDRNALPAPELSGDSLGIGYVAPRNATEELLVGIWTEVLKVERIGVHDNFFALGGHSLLAIQVVARIEQEGLSRLPIRAIFISPTVASLATMLKSPNDTFGASSAGTIPRIRRRAQSA
jgi:amino acid adenylation domain-containing protein